MKLTIAIGRAAMLSCLLLEPTWAQQNADGPPVAPFLQLLKLSQSVSHEHPTYSCDLRKVFNQCRQYAVFPVPGESSTGAPVGDPCLAMGGTLTKRIAQIEESCSSLGGTLIRSACPTENLVARCKAIKFRRDMNYDNSYYRGEPSHWSEEQLIHVCKNLPGQLELPQSTGQLTVEPADSVAP